MKKAILLVFILVFAFGTLSCAIVHKTDYKYADSYAFSGVNFIDANFWEEIRSHSNEIEFDSAEVLKEGIEMFFPKLDFDWDNLSNVKIASAVMSGEIAEVRELSKNTLAYINQSCAAYDSVSNTIFVFPNFVLAEPETQVYVLLRELMLAAIDAKENSHLEEGIADFYASLFINEANISIRSYEYPNEMMTALWLFSAFGEGEVIRAVREDRLSSLIDQGTKPGMAEKIENALRFLYWGDKNDGVGRNAAINLIYDVLAHASANNGKTEETDYLFDATKDVCDTQGMILDTGYIESVLHAKSTQKKV